MKSLIAILGGASLLAFSHSATAQTATDDAENAANRQDDTIVVTASSREQRLIDAPASISVVTAEDLALRPIQDLTDILDRMEGVTINRAGNQRTIQLRGLPSAYTLFLIDGKRVSASTTNFRGNDFDGAWVPVEAIERVEVVRGPLSSLYGSDAIGGVVNIITKSVGDSWHGSLTGDYTYQQDRDAADLYKVGGYVSGPIVEGKLGIKAYGGINIRGADRSGVNPVPPGGGDPLPGFDRQKEYYFDTTMVWTPDEHSELSANYGYNKLIHGETPVKRDSFALVYKGNWDFGNGMLRASYDRIHNEAGTVSGIVSPNTSKDLILDGRFNFPWESAHQTITVGAEYRRQQLHDPASFVGLPGGPAVTNASAKVNQTALFIEDEIRITDDLRVTVGNRYDDHENFGGHHSPRAYVVWHPVQNLTFKGGWARAFRAPTLVQNSPNWGSVSCGSATTGCYIIGSTTLKPETSTSIEASLRYDSPVFAAGITFFRNKLKDQINIENRTRDVTEAPLLPNFVGFLPDGRPIFAYENISRVQTQGIEASAQINLSSSFDIQANYSYLEAENRSYAEPRAIPFTPKHSGNLSFNWRPTDALSFFATGNYVGHQYLAVYGLAIYNEERSGYLTVDTSASYKVNDNLVLRGGILNLFNEKEKRLTLSEYNEEGRRFFLSATAKF